MSQMPHLGNLLGMSGFAQLAQLAQSRCLLGQHSTFSAPTHYKEHNMPFNRGDIYERGDDRIMLDTHYQGDNPMAFRFYSMRRTGLFRKRWPAEWTCGNCALVTPHTFIRDGWTRIVAGPEEKTEPAR